MTTTLELLPLTGTDFDLADDQDDVRGMALTSDMPWDEFLERVTGKFGRARDGLGMKFKDEDGVKVSLRDEMDWDLAMETVRESAQGKMEGRLEIWCTDE